MKVFITDGTAESFYTAVFVAYRESGAVITSQKNRQLSFDSEIIIVKTDNEKVARVRAKLDKLDRFAAGDIDLALRSCDSLKEQTAFEYIKLLVNRGRPVRRMLSEPTVIEMTAIIERVTGELHKMKGFLRFMETANGALYAPYSPDNDITDLIAPHFKARMGEQKFVIHDTKRKKAALCDGKTWFMAEVGDAEVYLSEYEKVFENLWKKYYASVNIKERPHEKQMKGYMPVRYWKFLPEKNGLPDDEY